MSNINVLYKPSEQPVTVQGLDADGELDWCNCANMVEGGTTQTYWSPEYENSVDAYQWAMVCSKYNCDHSVDRDGGESW